MPAELVEEVWEEMCAKYRSKIRDSSVTPNLSSSLLSKRKREDAVAAQTSNPQDKDSNWEQKSHSARELEKLLSTWDWDQNEETDYLNSLLAHSQWLLAKNQLDRVLLFCTPPTSLTQKSGWLLTENY